MEDKLEDLKLSLDELKNRILELNVMMQENKIVYTNEDVAKMFGVCPYTLAKWRSRGLIGFSKQNNIIVYSRKDIIDFLDSNHYSAF
jgi:hypothetical protein